MSTRTVTDATRDRRPPPRPVAGTGTAPPRAWSSPAAGPALAALAVAVSVAAWLPFLHTPLGSDESGFLLLARHWRHGTSLYGDYWVDRPPLLLWLFAAAGHLGPVSVVAGAVVAPGVKVVGAVASGIAVILTGVLTSLVVPAGGRLRRAAVLLAVVLLSTPLFGMPEVDGELLALPFVLAGLACFIATLRVPFSRRSLVLAGAAGASGMCAALVKQNVVDVFVLAAVAWVVTRRRAPVPWRSVAAFGAGSLTVLAAVVMGASARGSSPSGLWDAVVVFRLRASAVIGSSASEATSDRMTHVLSAALDSGACAVLVLTVALVLRAAYRRHRRTPRTRASVRVPSPMLLPEVLVWPVLALVAWEISGVVLGGSYWLHYLTGLVPGLVLLVSITPPGRTGRRLLAASLVYATMAGAWVWAHHATAPAAASTDAEVVTYLRQHAAPTDGVVVAFGHADIVAASGLTSPYPELWSLPVKVRDPRLTELQEVLSGASTPRWVVVGGDSLSSWGLQGDSAQQYLVHHYVVRISYGDWHVWERQAPVTGSRRHRA